jgi:hypothetical protein
MALVTRPKRCLSAWALALAVSTQTVCAQAARFDAREFTQTPSLRGQGLTLLAAVAVRAEMGESQ